MKNALQLVNCTHYCRDPVKRKIAALKRESTNIQKYGRRTALSSNQYSTKATAFYQRQKEKINRADTYSKQKTIKLLRSKKFNYKRYFGKSKSRTLQKDDICLYKSVIKHTDRLSFLSHRKNHFLPFTLRLFLVGKYKLNIKLIERQFFCRCGKHVIYDLVTQKFLPKSYCKEKGCKLSPNGPDHYKYKYGDKWEDVYNAKIVIPLKSPEGKEKRQRAGRIAYQKRKTRTDTNFHALGKNEEALLNEQEKKDNCIIDRHFSVDGFYPDGYCHKTNTIYEVYEKYHSYPSQIIKDRERQKLIQKKLNCKFVIIKDGY